MEEMIMFLAVYGWQLALIALLGIILLGMLKYANVFGKVDKDKRKPIYFAVSVGFSAIAAAVYLLIVGRFDINYFLAVTGAIYALNQTMYAVYETTTLRDLVAKHLKLVVDHMEKKASDERENFTKGS